MKPKEIPLKQALNKAYRLVKPRRQDIELFKANLITLLGRIDEKESEENVKNHLHHFLRDTFYNPAHLIATKGRTDLVIHTGKDAKSPAGVLFEVKRPTNLAEMVSRTNLNARAMHELMLYYLRERIDHNNTDIRHLIITNIHEWYIFDAQVFEKLFYQNKALVNDYKLWAARQKVSVATDLFYNEVAKPFLASLDEEISFTWFDIRSYEKPLKNIDQTDDNKLIPLFKIFSPTHLLKLSFANDSNSLDRGFYSELLYIIGLEEVKDGSKKLIRRKKAGSRNDGSLLENTIAILETEDSLRKVSSLSTYGDNKDDQLFSVGLELCITWINRILFLKLLEAQLLRYHKGDNQYRFLYYDNLPQYDELYKLFFQVLARRPEERIEKVKNKFRLVPYLNSSLFEFSELEDATIKINMLDDGAELPLLSSTVLRNERNKPRADKLSTLQYLFEFLDAYDFTSEGGEEIQEQGKTLINASVLGLIFEKINGYKDGSFFTPGFITMYMCREAIRRAVVQKFNDAKQWDCETITDVYNKITDRTEANKIINSLTICDPAVGSGHFLVSALNEIISIKSEMELLQDSSGKRLKNYDVEVVNDELIISDDNNELFEYNPQRAESRRVQETLFHEKQTIIENCLFGVDINPKSVQICRLRLWIELLKNAYYKTSPEGEVLETLPNIDINIKTGNSLVSRFAIDADLKQALKESKWSIEGYRNAVAAYRNAENKKEKQDLLSLINKIKNDFRSEISSNDPKLFRLSKLKGEVFNLVNQGSLFENTEAQKKSWNLKLEKLNTEIVKLETEIEEIRANKIYENAFEWRFEFPEVLNEEGDFVGFDVVIGNPPYISLNKLKDQSTYFASAGYETYSKGADLYCLFYELGGRILKNSGILTYITSNSWLRAIYGDLLKLYFKKNLQPISLLNIEDLQIFDEATVESNILILEKKKLGDCFYVANLFKNYKIGSSLSEYFLQEQFSYRIPDTSEWIIGNGSSSLLKQKIENGSKLLREFNVRINFGIKTGFNDAFIINEEKKEVLISTDAKNFEIIKPILRGRDMKKYFYEFKNQYMINSHNGLKSKNISRINVEDDYPHLYNHLKSFSPKVESRFDQGDTWSNLRNCTYLEDFQKPKIIWGEISDKPKFAFDEDGYYAEATTFLMTGEKLKFLLGILNSKLSEWYFNFIGTTTGMGTNRWKKYKIEQLPIKVADENQEKEIIDVVDEIIKAKKENPFANTSFLEAQVDQLVYQLYGLTEDEIKIVEHS